MEVKPALAPPKDNISRGEFLSRSAQVSGAVAAASSFGGSLAAAHAAPASASDPVVLRLQNWFTESDMPYWQVGLNIVKQAYPNISVKLEFVDYNDVAVKTTAEALAGNVPDLIMCSTDHTPALISNGLLTDLTPFIAKDPGVNIKDFYSGVSNGFLLGGRWWGFPFDNTSWGLYYNKSLFDAAKVSYPPPATRATPWSWNELVSAAKALTKPNGKQWGLYWGNPPWALEGPLANWVLGAGGRNFVLPLGSCIIDSPETAAAVQFAVDLIHKYKVAPTPQELGNPNNAIDFFSSGLAAMSIGASWHPLFYEKSISFPWDVGSSPLGKKKLIWEPGSGFAISTSTKHPQEAWQWLKAFTGKNVLASAIGSSGRSVPARRSAATSFVTAAKSKGIKYAGIFLQEDEYGLNDLISLAAYEYFNFWNTEMEPIFTSGHGDIRAALAKIQSQTNAVIKQKQKSIKVKI